MPTTLSRERQSFTHNNVEPVAWTLPYLASWRVLWMMMSPPTEKRYPVSDGIHHPPLVSDGDSQGICVKSGAVDSPGALVGSLG